MNNLTDNHIHIIYASTSGNTEFVIDKVADIWQKSGRKVSVHRAEMTDISIIKNNKYFLLATSTWDHGTINPFFDKLLEKMKKSNFSSKTAAFIGLGDRRYEKHHFCSGMALLKQIWEENGGKSIGLSLTIGREPFDKLIQKMIVNWAKKTLLEFDNN